MKLGLKIRENSLNLINKYKNFFDFYEIYINPNFNLELLKKLKCKITIHAAHFEDGFDPSNINKYKLNLKILLKAIEAANIVRSPWIIVHPGHLFSDKSKKNMLEFFDKNWDNRIIFENCPAIDFTENKRKYLFSSPKEMRLLLKRYNAQFVLDFGHAICTANVLKNNPITIINNFLKLNPICFHLSGIDIDSKIDTHKNLFEVKNDFNFIKKIKKSQYVTLETYKSDLHKKSFQLKNINLIKSII